MTMTWHLRGFDKRTEFLAIDFEIPQAMVPEAQDDPDFADPHEITRDQTVKLAAALALAIDPDLYHYSVESEDDPYVVAARTEALCARA